MTTARNVGEKVNKSSYTTGKTASRDKERFLLPNAVFSGQTRLEKMETLNNLMIKTVLKTSQNFT
jgi:hypothetical protein